MTTLVLSKTEQKSRLAKALLLGARKSRPMLITAQGQRFKVNAKLAQVVLRKRKKPLTALSLDEEEIALMNSAPLVNVMPTE